MNYNITLGIVFGDEKWIKHEFTCVWGYSVDNAIEKNIAACYRQLHDVVHVWYIGKTESE